MNTDANSPAGRGPFFPDWPGALQADDSLSPGLRESYRRTLAGFLAFCQRRGRRPSVALAREYVELAQLEEGPSPGRLQEWKDGLNWYFRRGREALNAALADVPALARTDLGQTDWEQQLIEHPCVIFYAGSAWQAAGSWIS